MSLLQTRLRWQKIAQSGRPAQLRAAILASFTANPVAPYLGVALEDNGLPAEVWTGPYNQIVQQCLYGESETVRFEPNMLICWARLEEMWNGQPLPLAGDTSAYANEIIELAETCLDAARRWQAALIFVLPAIPDLRPLGLGDASISTGVFATATMVREQLRRRLAGQRGVLLIDAEEVVREIGASRAYNPRLFALARIPFTEEFFSAIGERMARLICLSRKPAKKVAVVDGDNTLWGGAVGEEGAAGVDLGSNGPGEAYLAFQSFLLELRRAGMLLALASKNNESDVWEIFSRREMRLKKEHFAAWRIGWQSKSSGLREMAEELGLGLDSFVFIDDNPAEIAEVQSSLPEVACITMPADCVEWQKAIQSSGMLDRLPPTTEDLTRANYYEQEQKRKLDKSGSVSPEQYLAGLGVKASIFEPTKDYMPRFAQLVAKTNQFNLNCRRLSDVELSGICASDKYMVRLVHTQDSFGDYGVVGAFIVRLDAARAELDAFLLSCRALGRGIEEAMLAYIFGELGKRGITQVFAAVEDAPRNEPARRFFAKLGCDKCGVMKRVDSLDWPSHVQLV